MPRFSGELLRTRRVVAGLSIEQVAVATGRSYHTIKHLETDEIKPSMTTFGALIVALGCRPDDLLTDLPEPDDRHTDLGPVSDAWVERTLKTAPRLTEAQARRVSAALFPTGKAS